MTFLDRLSAKRQWTEEERLVLDQVTRVADEIIAPAAAGYDQSRDYPEDSMAALNELGMNAIFVPEVYGGALMSYRLYLECVSIISTACASTGIIYATNFHGIKPLIDFGAEEQKLRLLPRIAEAVWDR